MFSYYAALVLLCGAAWAALCTAMWCGLGQLCGTTLWNVPVVVWRCAALPHRDVPCSSLRAVVHRPSAALLWLGHSDFTTFAHQLWCVLGRLPVVVLSAAHGRDHGVKTPIQRCRWESKHMSISMQISTTYSNFFSSGILSSSFP